MIEKTSTPQNNPYNADMIVKFILHSKNTIYDLHAKNQTNSTKNKNFTPLYSIIRYLNTSNIRTCVNTFSAISQSFQLLLT